MGTASVAGGVATANIVVYTHWYDNIQNENMHTVVVKLTDMSYVLCYTRVHHALSEYTMCASHR